MKNNQRNHRHRSQHDAGILIWRTVARMNGVGQNWFIDWLYVCGQNGCRPSSVVRGPSSVVVTVVIRDQWNEWDEPMVYDCHRLSHAHYGSDGVIIERKLNQMTLCSPLVVFIRSIGRSVGRPVNWNRIRTLHQNPMITNWTKIVSGLRTFFWIEQSICCRFGVFSDATAIAAALDRWSVGLVFCLSRSLKTLVWANSSKLPVF